MEYKKHKRPKWKIIKDAMLEHGNIEISDSLARDIAWAVGANYNSPHKGQSSK